MTKSAGIHHITGIATDPRRHVAFYTGALGLRMVKKTVNFDDPGSWHLYFGDETGAPGTALTFFLGNRVSRGRPGVGQAVETAFAVPPDAIGYWTARLGEKGIAHAAERRFGQSVITLADPNGLRLELIGSPGAEALPGWSNGDVPAEHAIRGFHGVTLWVANPEPTARVLTGVFGLAAAGAEATRSRFVADGPLGGVVDLRTAADAAAGELGAGTLHHVAFRAASDAQQRDMAERARQLGLRPTEQINRIYFRSVYFREPGGVLFEIATDDPGFTVDEAKEALGTTVRLPPWYEARRPAIEAALPPLA